MPDAAINEEASLAALALKSEYRSDGDDLVLDFYLPCLSRSVDYRRAVGYFTSYGLAVAAQGLSALIKSGGRMSLVASPLFTAEDLDAIHRGYDARSNIVTRSLLRSFDTIEDSVVESRLGFLAWLIAEGRLDIRVALPFSEKSEPRSGIYHEKLGIFSDRAGHAVAFTGSPNETAGGLIQNFETIDVFCSWDDPQQRVRRKRANFERLWKNETAGLSVIAFPEAARMRLLKFRPERAPAQEAAPPHHEHQPAQVVVNHWRHQDAAIAAFIAREQGILEMATGTGKTRTSLHICERLFADNAIDTIIVSADGNDLLDQWNIQLLELTKCLSRLFAVIRDYKDYRERERFLIDPRQAVLLVSRPNLAAALRALSTEQAGRTLLIHDEVHRLGSPGNRASLHQLSDRVRYRLGLSATPEREYDQDGNDFIENHIGPVVFRFGLEDAIRRGVLSPFNYFPIEYVPSAEDRFRIQQVFRKAAARREAGTPMSKEEVWIELARVHKTSLAKLPLFEDFIQAHQDLLERCIIFVETQEYGDEVLKIVHKYRHDFHTYFAEEDASTLKRFAQGDIECLLTCHRLSEGIDIRSLKTVILFSSSRARLETIQRMGRCLRIDPANPNKRANVVDFVRVGGGDDGNQDSSDDERRHWLAQLAGIQVESSVP